MNPRIQDQIETMPSFSLVCLVDVNLAVDNISLDNPKEYMDLGVSSVAIASSRQVRVVWGSHILSMFGGLVHAYWPTGGRSRGQGYNSMQKPAIEPELADTYPASVLHSKRSE